MNEFTLRYRAAPDAEEKEFTFDHDKADWTDVCNRARAKLHPDHAIVTPAWLTAKFK